MHAEVWLWQVPVCAEFSQVVHGSVPVVPVPLPVPDPVVVLVPEQVWLVGKQ